MMLCGVSVVFNSLGNVLGLMSCERSSENGQVLVGFQSTEAFGCLHHAGGGPAPTPRGISPRPNDPAAAAAWRALNGTNRNGNCQIRPAFDTYGAKSVDSTGLFSMLITRGVSPFDHLSGVARQG